MKVKYLVFKALENVYAGYDEPFFEENLCRGATTTLTLFERLRRWEDGEMKYYIFIMTENKVAQPDFEGLEFIFVTPKSFISMRSTMRFAI
jgi:hypothetical protein